MTRAFIARVIRQTVQRRAIPPERVYPRWRRVERKAANIFRKNQREQAGKRGAYTSTYFEIDRSTVTRQLRNLRRVVGEGATEMEMVAAERVFGKALSRALMRRARKLHLIAKDLDSLLRLVARAQIPKEAERPKPKMVPRLPTKARKDF